MRSTNARLSNAWSPKWVPFVVRPQLFREPHTRTTVLTTLFQMTTYAGKIRLQGKRFRVPVSQGSGHHATERKCLSIRHADKASLRDSCSHRECYGDKKILHDVLGNCLGFFSLLWLPHHTRASVCTWLLKFPFRNSLGQHVYTTFTSFLRERSRLVPAQCSKSLSADLSQICRLL